MEKSFEACAAETRRSLQKLPSCGGAEACKTLKQHDLLDVVMLKDCSKNGGQTGQMIGEPTSDRLIDYEFNAYLNNRGNVSQRNANSADAESLGRMESDDWAESPALTNVQDFTFNLLCADWNWHG